MATSDLSQEKPELAALAVREGLSWGLAWPVIAHWRVQSICVLLD